MISKKQIYFYGIILISLGAALFLYYKINPQSDYFFLKCPFKMATGLDCPGCGSQRALHSLMHGEFRQAFSYNPIFIFAIPYLFAGILLEWFGLKYKYPQLRKILFGTKSIYLAATIIIVFFVLRNF